MSGMEGRRLPEVTFKTRVRDETIAGDNPFRWQDVTTSELFGGKRVVAFGLPGAFTPTCSNEQCPGFDREYDRLKPHGIDTVYCVSVNDAFVMYQWSLKLGTKNIKFLPDGSGDFTRRLGMLVDKRHLGFGYRSWRYAMVVNDGVIEKWFEEAGINDEGSDEDPYVMATPEQVIDYLDRNREPVRA